MYILVMIVHVVVCLVLILVVLLQAGRGGGFSDMLGGGQPQSLFGTQTNAFMMKATEVCAVLFIITSLSLGMMSSHKGRSLITGDAVARDIQTQIPAIPPVPPVPAAAPATVPAAAVDAPAPATVPVPAEANAK